MPALIFDCDGVLADTERDGHLPAFNQTFERRGFARPVERAGVRRVLRSAAARSGWRACSTPEFVERARAARGPDGQRAAIAAWHKRRRRIYTEMVAAGGMPGAPGIARIVGGPAAGWPLAVASTSAEASVRAVLEHAVGAESRLSVRRCSPATWSPPRSPPGDLPAGPRASSGSTPTTRSSSRTANGLRAAVGAGLAERRDRQQLHRRRGLHGGRARRRQPRRPATSPPPCSPTAAPRRPGDHVTSAISTPA